MKPLKVISIIVLFMSIYALFMVPMEAGQFPSWLNTDLIQLMIMLLMVVCVLVLIR